MTPPPVPPVLPRPASASGSRCRCRAAADADYDDAGTPLAVTVEDRGGVCVVHADGEVDIATAPLLGRRAGDRAGQRPADGGGRPAADLLRRLHRDRAAHRGPVPGPRPGHPAAHPGRAGRWRAPPRCSSSPPPWACTRPARGRPAGQPASVAPLRSRFPSSCKPAAQVALGLVGRRGEGHRREPPHQVGEHVATRGVALQLAPQLGQRGPDLLQRRGVRAVDALLPAPDLDQRARGCRGRPGRP